MKLHAPALLAVVVPSLTPSTLHTVTVELATAVPVSVTESFELTAALLMTGAAGGSLVAVAVGTVKSSALDFTLVPAAVVSVAVNAYEPAAKTAVVKLQTKELLEVAVPSEFAPPSDTVTMEPAAPSQSG